MLDGEDKIKDLEAKLQDTVDEIERAIAIWEFIKAAAPPDRAELIRAFYSSIFEKKTGDSYCVATVTGKKTRITSKISGKERKTAEKSAPSKTLATKRPDPCYGQKKADFQIQDGVFVKYTGSQSHVIIPDSVTAIGESAFENYSSLKSIKIGEKVTSIGPLAFSGCIGLTGITIPDSVTNIERYAFSGCAELTNVTIGNGVNCIGWRAFKDCVSLTSVTIPDSVTDIVNDAFHGCSNLTYVLFKNPNGWRCAPSASAKRSIYIPRHDIRDPFKAAQLLKSSYENRHWKRTHYTDDAMYNALDDIDELDDYDYWDGLFDDDLYDENVEDDLNYDVDDEPDDDYDIYDYCDGLFDDDLYDENVEDDLNYDVDDEPDDDSNIW